MTPEAKWYHDVYDYNRLYNCYNTLIRMRDEGRVSGRYYERRVDRIKKDIRSSVPERYADYVCNVLEPPEALLRWRAMVYAERFRDG